MRNVLRVSALMTAAALLAATGVPAAAKTCKAAVASKGLSTSAATPDKREERARSSAIAKWRSASQAKYGVAYRFWSRADERKVECKKGKEVTRCTVSAKPCRLL